MASRQQAHFSSAVCRYIELYRLFMAQPMPMRLHVRSPLGNMFATGMAQAMRTLGVHPGHVAPTGPNADRAVLDSRISLSAAFIGDASVATDFGEVIWRAVERLFGFCPTFSFLASLKFNAALERTDDAAAHEHGAGAKGDEPIERVFEPMCPASLPNGLAMQICEPGFISNAEVAIQQMLDAASRRKGTSVIVSGVSRSERSDGGGVRVVPMARLGGNLPILRMSTVDFGHPGTPVAARLRFARNPAKRHCACQLAAEILFSLIGCTIRLQVP
eukprot:5673030-Amphidinium_carterae.1